MEAREAERLRARLSELFEREEQIHMDISQAHPKLELRDTAATLCGVYPHIFRIAETSTGEKRYHTIPYTDLLLGSIVIRELRKPTARQ